MGGRKGRGEEIENRGSGGEWGRREEQRGGEGEEERKGGKGEKGG